MTHREILNSVLIKNRKKTPFSVINALDETVLALNFTLDEQLHLNNNLVNVGFFILTVVVAFWCVCRKSSIPKAFAVAFNSDFQMRDLDSLLLLIVC